MSQVVSNAYLARKCHTWLAMHTWHRNVKSG